MTVPNDSTTSLPSDNNGQIYWGLWDVINKVFRAVRGRANGALIIGKEKGSVTTNTPITATTISGLLLAANTTRIKAVFYNNSTNTTVFINGGSAALISSQPIPPGCQWVDEESTDTWNVITSSSTALVNVLEYS